MPCKTYYSFISCFEIANQHSNYVLFAYNWLLALPFSKEDRTEGSISQLNPHLNKERLQVGPSQEGKNNKSVPGTQGPWRVMFSSSLGNKPSLNLMVLSNMDSVVLTTLWAHWSQPGYFFHSTWCCLGYSYLEVLQDWTVLTRSLQEVVGALSPGSCVGIWNHRGGGSDPGKMSSDVDLPGSSKGIPTGPHLPSSSAQHSLEVLGRIEQDSPVTRPSLQIRYHTI